MYLKKFRKAVRIFIPKKLSPIEKITKEIFFEEIKSINFKDNKFEVTFINNIKVFVRDEKHSDLYVFKQIFIQQEYKLIKKLLQLNATFNYEKNIIDAGANVGYTTVYFSAIFKNSNIFAIEPSLENTEMFLKNINDLENKSTITLYQNALSHIEGLQFDINRNFRDGKDWSIATEENLDGNISGVSIPEIIVNNNLKHISLLKIDIEGAERFIFRLENDLSFLKITEIIAVEIHDEYEIRDSINNILISNGFLIFEVGELTVGINKKMLNV